MRAALDFCAMEGRRWIGRGQLELPVPWRGRRAKLSQEEFPKRCTSPSRRAEIGPCVPRDDCPHPMFGGLKACAAREQPAGEMSRIGNPMRAGPGRNQHAAGSTSGGLLRITGGQLLRFPADLAAADLDAVEQVTVASGRVLARRGIEEAPWRCRLRALGRAHPVPLSIAGWS